MVGFVRPCVSDANLFFCLNLPDSVGFLCVVLFFYIFAMDFIY